MFFGERDSLCGMSYTIEIGYEGIWECRHLRWIEACRFIVSTMEDSDSACVCTRPRSLEPEYYLRRTVPSLRNDTWQVEDHTSSYDFLENVSFAWHRLTESSLISHLICCQNTKIANSNQGTIVCRYSNFVAAERYNPQYKMRSTSIYQPPTV
jgi:hypothetical protein